MRAIRFISWQSRYRRDAFLAARYCPGGQGERYDQILAFAYPDNSLSPGERHAQPASYYPKRKPGWRKNAAVAAYITR